MKNLLIGLATIITASSSMACMGGDTIQVIVENNGVKTVMANYNKKTGARTYLNAGVSFILAMKAHGGSACTTEKATDCTQLSQMDNDDVVFIMVSKNAEAKARAKSVSEVTVNEHMATAKGAGLDIGENQMPIEKDSVGAVVMGCSQK